MKSIFSSRRNKQPHSNEEAEKETAPFFSKESKAPFFKAAGNQVQTKLTVGQPGDKYEKEADSMADAVVNSSGSKPSIQNKEISSIQRESLATPQEDEKLGTAEQRMEEDKLVQEKPEIQRMDKTEVEEGMVHKMEGEDDEMIHKMDAEKEEKEPMEPVQTKSTTGTNTASQAVSQQIKNKSGKGKKLPTKTQAEMEASFKTDFEGVNIHTDEDSVKMNKELGAQAFTHGQDIYFNSGKYNPDTTTGKHLLAHELTHVVQQNSKKMVQRQTGGATPARRQRPQRRQRVYVIRDREISLGGGSVLVPDLNVFKRRVMRTRNQGDWTLVLSIHGSQERLAAQSPPNWQQNAIFYTATEINALFNNDPDWVEWRNQYGPTRLSLVSCQVSSSFEGVLISNLVRTSAGDQTQSDQGLGAGCKPLARVADLDVFAPNRRALARMNDEDRARFMQQLSALNRTWGYFGAPPVPESQLLDYFFDETPRPGWAIVEVTHHGRATGIPFWNRSSEPHAARFRQLCDQGVGTLRERTSRVPETRSN